MKNKNLKKGIIRAWYYFEFACRYEFTVGGEVVQSNIDFLIHPQWVLYQDESLRGDSATYLLSNWTSWYIFHLLALAPVQQWWARNLFFPPLIYRSTFSVSNSLQTWAVNKVVSEEVLSILKVALWREDQPSVGSRAVQWPLLNSIHMTSSDSGFLSGQQTSSSHGSPLPPRSSPETFGGALAFL